MGLSGQIKRRRWISSLVASSKEIAVIIITSTVIKEPSKESTESKIGALEIGGL